jgi:hypothetical protein
MHARIRLMTICLVLSATLRQAPAQVVSWEGTALPEHQEWERSTFYIPERWIDGTWFYQELTAGECAPPPGGDRDSYRRSVEAFSGASKFFLEFRLQADGDRSEIQGGAPALLVMANDIGIVYHLTIADDLVKFFRAADLPVLLIEVGPGLPHTFRLDLTPGLYTFYIDGYVIDEGPPDGALLGYNPRSSWHGQSWYLPCHNAWDYIRYGVLPQEASGDYDSNGVVGEFDYYLFQDCLTKDGPGIFGGPENDAGPACRFADFSTEGAAPDGEDDGPDGDVDLLDFAEFQNLFCSADPRRSPREPGCPVRPTRQFDD